IGVGVLMIIYVVFGGMLATTWVQIVKAILLMAGTILLSLLVLKHFGWSLANFFEAVTHVTYHDKGALVTKNFLEPGLRYTPANHGALDLISLGMALVFGTAGLPHILVRFYTVPDAKTARVSVVWAMVLIGTFYIMTTFLGFGAATIVGRDRRLLASLGLTTTRPRIMTVAPRGVVGAARHLIQHSPIFPLRNPGILSIPVRLLGAILGSLLSREPRAESRFAELSVRA